MRLRAATLIFTLIAMTAFAQNTTLRALRDQSRPLLIFAPTAGDPRVQQQVADLSSHAAGLRDRDMRVLVLPASSALLPSHLPAASLAAEEERQTRLRFHVAPNEFVVVLLGKDGGEKLRSGTPLPWQRIVSTVDSMPMRQDEMRQR